MGLVALHNAERVLLVEQEPVRPAQLLLPPLRSRAPELVEDRLVDRSRRPVREEDLVCAGECALEPHRTGIILGPRQYGSCRARQRCGISAARRWYRHGQRADGCSRGRISCAVGYFSEQARSSPRSSAAAPTPPPAPGHRLLILGYFLTPESSRRRPSSSAPPPYSSALAAKPEASLTSVARRREALLQRRRARKRRADNEARSAQRADTRREPKADAAAILAVGWREYGSHLLGRRGRGEAAPVSTSAGCRTSGPRPSPSTSCSASSPTSGTTTVEVEELAELLRSTPEGVEEALETLVEAGFVVRRDGWLEVAEHPPSAKRTSMRRSGGRDERASRPRRRGDKGRAGGGFG